MFIIYTKVIALLLLVYRNNSINYFDKTLNLKKTYHNTENSNDNDRIITIIMMRTTIKRQ